MADSAANSFELLRNRDLMLQQWRSKNQSKREDEKRRKMRFLQALQSFKPSLTAADAFAICEW